MLVDVDTDKEPTDEEALAVMECVMLKLQGCGNHGIDAHRIMVATHKAGVKEWARDSIIDSNDSFLIKKQSRDLLGATWELLVLDSKAAKPNPNLGAPEYHAQCHNPYPNCRALECYRQYCEP